MIDKETGRIYFSNSSQEIYREMGRLDFLASSLKSSIKREDSCNSYSIYVLYPMELWKEKFNVIVTFDPNGTLFDVRMSFYSDPPRTWDNWSEEEQKSLKVAQDQFLERNLGQPPYKYPWGIIESTYDQKGGSSGITIRYY